MEDGKICTKCNKWKPYSEFNKKEERSKDGYRSDCKSCQSEWFRTVYWPKHREEYNRTRNSKRSRKPLTEGQELINRKITTKAEKIINGSWR